jgi:hypothetical protein
VLEPRIDIGFLRYWHDLVVDPTGSTQTTGTVTAYPRANDVRIGLLCGKRPQEQAGRANLKEPEPGKDEEEKKERDHNEQSYGKNNCEADFLHE